VVSVRVVFRAVHRADEHNLMGGEEMALDFGHGNGESKPYFKQDARVGICKLRLDKGDEPQINFSFRLAPDIQNLRQLWLLFLPDGGPQRLFFNDTITRDTPPPAIGETPFKIGFEVFMFLPDKHESMNGDRIGVLPWTACSVGATMSLNEMHDLWLAEGGGEKPDAVPLLTCTGSEVVSFSKGSTNKLKFQFDKWVMRDQVPGLGEALASRPTSNISLSSQPPPTNGDHEAFTPAMIDEDLPF
jgi:hypothetical protein